ncbi:MAG: DUF512 domain-containing protein, partial [Actinomycetota bacterium]
MTLRMHRSARVSAGWRPPRIKEVRGDSVCRGQVKEDDLLLEVGGRPPHDVLDYLEASQKDRVNLRLERAGREITFKSRKQTGEPLGLVFDEAVFDGVRTCRNNCIFCFVDQMPRGMRPTLYIKDDDYRLSFYHGNFITLNNLSREDMRRIKRMRLSPLYVSLHTTDPGLRDFMMGGNAGRGLEALEVLLDAGIRIHLQVVVCPGINDGEFLRRTMEDVLDRYPAESLGVVPLGLTSKADTTSGLLRPHDADSARRVIDLVEEYQPKAVERRGGQVFFVADEFYLLSGRDFPGEEEYEGYPQLENGIGMARKFINEVRSETSSVFIPEGTEPPALLTGFAGERVIEEALREANPRREVEVVT